MLTKNYETIFVSVRKTSSFLNRVEVVVTCLRESKAPLTAKQILTETNLRAPVQHILDMLVRYGFVGKEVREEGIRTTTKMVVNDDWRWEEQEVTFPVRRAYYTWVG